MGDGKALTAPDTLKATRTYIGVETVNIGYTREGVHAGADWADYVTPDQKQVLQIQPWTTEQITMLIAVGKEIVARWPNIKPRDHHGHVDICPGYKLDPLAFPYAEVLRSVYNQPNLPDVWSPFATVVNRQKVLVDLGYLGSKGADGIWGPKSDAALKKFQTDRGLLGNGFWSTAVGWAVYDALTAKKLVLPPAPVMPLAFGMEDEPTARNVSVIYNAQKDPESVVHHSERS
jgi:hypothetical protein